MTTAETRKVLERYLQGHDATALAEDAEFTIMGSGQRARGQKEVEGLLEFFYHRAFEAKAEVKNLVVDGDKAVLEATFVGRHIGEFGDLKPTGKPVRVPLCVTYGVRNGKIASANVYFETDSLRKQVGAP
jgi:predicted ester cyclase